MTQHWQPLYSLAPLLLLGLTSCTQPEQPVHPGDKVMVDYTCRLNDGSLVETTRASLAGNKTLARSPFFSLRGDYSPFIVQVPEQPKIFPMAPYDPLEQKIIKAIVNRTNEFQLNQTVFMHLASEEVKDFAPVDRFVTMAKHFPLERMVEMKVDDFMTRYGNTPRAIGTKVDEGADYPGVIRGINDTAVTIYYSAGPGATVPSVMGPAPVRELDADNFEVNIPVQPGQLVQRVGGLPGKISSVDKDLFTIDFGQTFAGETLNCEVTMHPVVPEHSGNTSQVHWIDDYQQGLSQARRQNKLVLLLLTGNDCPDCGAMEKTLLTSPSLREQRDRYILVKIKGNQQDKFFERFGRQSYPLTLALDGMGNELMHMSGVQHIATIAYRLDQMLSKSNKD